MKKYLHIYILSGLVILAGCSTFEANPKPIDISDESPSYDNGERNSGILDVREEGFVVTPHFRARYNAMIEVYGERFTPTLAKDEGIRRIAEEEFLIDKRHMVYFLDMNQWRKAGL